MDRPSPAKEVNKGVTLILPKYLPKTIEDTVGRIGVTSFCLRYVHLQTWDQPDSSEDERRR